MNWMQRLQARWGLSPARVVLVLIVFACTGCTVLFLKRPLFRFLFDASEIPLWASIIYYVLILPVYNLFLLFYGAILGQFRFFWDFERRFFGRLFSIFKTKTKSSV